MRMYESKGLDKLINLLNINSISVLCFEEENRFLAYLCA